MDFITISAEICTFITCLSGCGACIAFIYFLITNGFHESAITALIICCICCCCNCASNGVAATSQLSSSSHVVSDK